MHTKGVENMYYGVRQVKKYNLIFKTKEIWDKALSIKKIIEYMVIMAPKILGYNFEHKSK